MLQTTLNISGSVTRKGGSWSINFDNAKIISTKGKASMTTPSINGTNLTFNATLAQPGDEVTFTFDVVNDGNITAKLARAAVFNSGGSLNNSTSSQYHENAFEWYNWNYEDKDYYNYTKPIISVKISYADGTKPSVGDTLAATTGTQTFKVVIRYEEFPEGVTPDADAMAQDETMSFSLGLTYQQA